MLERNGPGTEPYAKEPPAETVTCEYDVRLPTSPEREPNPALPEDTEVVLVLSTKLLWEKALCVVASFPSASVPVTQTKVGLSEEEDDEDDDVDSDELVSASTVLKRATSQIKGIMKGRCIDGEKKGLGAKCRM